MGVQSRQVWRIQGSDEDFWMNLQRWKFAVKGGRSYSDAIVIGS